MSEFIYFIVFLLCLILPLIFMEAKTKADEDKQLLAFERTQRDVLGARIAYCKVHIAKLEHLAGNLKRVVENDPNPQLKRVYDDVCYEIRRQKDILKMWECQYDALIKDAHHDLIND